MSRIYIITGAKGHLAGTIIRYLRNTDCQIRGLILPTEAGEDDDKLRYFKGDVTKPETLEALFDDAQNDELYVIHAAGIVCLDDAAAQRMYRVNVEGTRNVIAQCIRRRVKRLIYISSVHAIPESDSCATLSEVESFSKELVTGAYSATKAEATRAVMESVRAGLDAVIVHPSGILGPYDGGNNHMVQLIGMYMRGKLPAGMRGGYDFVDVRDVAKGCLLAAEKARAGACYILSNRYFTVKELLSYVRKVAGGRRLPCLPLVLARAFAPLFTWVARLSHARPLYTRSALGILSSSAHFSHDRATAELGYRPRDMLVTIADTVRWLRGEKVPPETE